MTNSINKQIIDLIKPNQRVLDCGCGQGDLLKALISKKNISGYGIDNKSEHIISCLQKGLSVYHGDIAEGLSQFPKDSFDVVILSSTLQQIADPYAIMLAMTDIADSAIVTFPNFAYWRCRLSLFRGYIPQTKALPYTWYNTPNIRVISIKSFKKLCQKQSISILN